MTRFTDEGYIDEDELAIESPTVSHPADDGSSSCVEFTMREREDIIYQLLAALPRSQIAEIHRRIAPYLQMDIVGRLPSELSLHIFSYLPWHCLVRCALVSRRWRTLSNDPSLWKRLCHLRNWQWKQPSIPRYLDLFLFQSVEDSDDEGMGEDEEIEEDNTSAFLEQDSGIGVSRIFDHAQLEQSGLPATPRRIQHCPNIVKRPAARLSSSRFRSVNRHSAPSILPSMIPPKPDYKLLHQTHILLRNRLLHGSYRFSTLQALGTPNSHSSTIYCLQLHTYRDGERQVLFTGSKDRSVREWDLTTGVVDRVFEGTHSGSVLSLCARGNYLATAGSDWLVCIWDLRNGSLIRMIRDHRDSVLCVRIDEKRLVSCSKDRSIRTYLLPSLQSHLVLDSHRAAVNAVSISNDQIVSASGDKSIRLWDANTGKLISIYEGHHARGIAAIDFEPPFILSGSSDKHIRLFDLNMQSGWSTSPEFHNLAPSTDNGDACGACGSSFPEPEEVVLSRGLRSRSWPPVMQNAHGDLVRSVALGQELVVSGSYDQSIKVWDRRTGAMIADLGGGHDGRIFCVGFDFTKIVSCGEDQKICIWDFSHGLDTSFISLQ